MTFHEIGLPEALERAASALPEHADAIRPANGDPQALGRSLERAAAVRVLAWLLQHEPGAGVELASAWAEAVEEGACLLREVDACELPKPARKALRRALHLLRSRGVALPEVPSAPRVAALPRVQDALDAALLTPIDPRGTRGVYLATSHPGGGARLFELVIDDDRGVIDCHVYSAGRSAVRKFLRDAERREQFAVVPAPSDSVRVLVARAAARHGPESPPPRSFAGLRSRLSAAPEAAESPGEIVRRALAERAAATPESAQRVVALVEQGSLGPWPPRDAVLSDAAAQLTEHGHSVLAMSAAQREEQLVRALEVVAQRIFDAPYTALTARRFEESAYVYWKSGGLDDAVACLSAARSLSESTRPENPVVRALLERMLAPTLASLRGDAEPEAPAAPVAVGS
jgi:hypothetical protein